MIMIMIIIVAIVNKVIVTDRALSKILAAAGRSDAARLLPHGTLRYVTQNHPNTKTTNDLYI